MEGRIIELQLPNGSTVLARVDGASSAGAEKTSSIGKFDFREVTAALEGLAGAIRDSLAKARPDQVSVELGLELAVKNGKLSGLLVEGEGKGSLTVTMEWSNSRDAETGP